MKGDFSVLNFDPHEHKRGVKAHYAKFETFPIWNLPLDHPVNLAYEAATADLDDVNMIDSEVALDAGPHAIRIDYFQRGGGKALELWWQPPGEQLQPVPPGVLAPQVR